MRVFAAPWFWVFIGLGLVWFVLFLFSWGVL